jgi:methylglutaconyl-CoA hydratase
MKDYQTIEFSIQEKIASISLNRPEVRNAFNDTMIKEFTEILDELDTKNEDIRTLILRGNGKVFSAGADLNWMKSMMNYSHEENVEDSRQLYQLFEKIYNLSMPVVTLVHGASIGGANGIIAASDIVLAENNTQFRFSEVKIGLVPATIAPFVVQRAGNHAAKYYMLTGKNFTTKDALRIGLIDSAGNRESIDTELDLLIKEFQKNSPVAVRETKKLLNKIDQYMFGETVKDLSVETISNARVSEEGQEGMKAFLEKREPYWKN